MTDYEDLQKRCQRGTTSLKEAHDIMAACYGMLGKLGAENERLRKVATELRNWVGCENVHHNKCERHEWDDPCTVLARIDKAMSKEG